MRRLETLPATSHVDRILRTTGRENQVWISDFAQFLFFTPMLRMNDSEPLLCCGQGVQQAAGPKPAGLGRRGLAFELLDCKATGITEYVFTQNFRENI